MPLPDAALTTTCDVYRPFGAATPIATGVPCRLTAVVGSGQPMAPSGLAWTHTLDVQPGVDLRDGCTRAAGSNAVTYGDGDMVGVPSGAGSTCYVVVWVEVLNRGTPVQFQRAYLLRDTAVWPGP
jgi:hypothetical protein